MKAPLTSRKVASLKPPESGQVDVFDERTPGFGVRITPSGRKSFVCFYRVGGKLRRWTIGSCDSLSLAEARARAKKARALAHEGQDPAAEKAEQRRSDDFAGLVERFFEDRAREIKPRTLYEWKRLAARELVPRFGRAKPGDIKRADVKTMMKDIADRAPVVANRAFELTRAIYRWAIREELVESSPCLGLKRYTPEKSRERVLASDELRAVWSVLDDQHTVTAGVVKLILLTAVRKGEALAARWVDIDAVERLWVIPQTKADRPHRLPLSSEALEVVASMREATGHTPYVFAGPLDKPMVSVDRAVDCIRQSSGTKDWTLHDLRRTVATELAKMRVPRDVRDRILNHVDGEGAASTRVYDRYDRLDEMRSSLDAWAHRLNAIVSNKSKGVADVVPLTRA